jgi:Holliday junction resolvase RusA-like endonuclease
VSEDIVFWIPGRAIGKARPRSNFKTKTIFTSPKYRFCKNKAIAAIALQQIFLPPAPKPCEVKCLFVNFFSSDSDNLTGMILDALVDAKFLKEDSSGFVADSGGKFCKVKKKRNEEKIQGTLVTITKAEIQTIDFSNEIWQKIKAVAV